MGYHSLPLNRKNRFFKSLILSLNAAQKGFTLIEVLIAAALMAVLLTALYGTFFSILTGTKTAQESLDDYLEAGRFLDRFTSDVHSAYYKPKDDLTLLKGEKTSDGSSLVLTIRSYPSPRKGEPTGDFAAVRYYLDMSEGRQRIMRESWNPYIGEKFSAEMTGKIKDFEVSFFNGKDWAKAWDTGLENRMPMAVRATVRLENGEEVFATARIMAR